MEVKKKRSDIGFDFPLGPNYYGTISPKVGLSEAIEHLASFSGIPIYFQEDNRQKQKLHTSGYTSDLKKEEWLEQVSKPYGKSRLTDVQFSILAQNLRLVDNTEPSLGFAAINPYVEFNYGCGAKTVGGLRADLSGGDTGFYGFIDCLPDSAKRNPAKFRATDAQIHNWAVEQLKLILASISDPISLHVLSSRLPNFYVNPTPYITLPIVRTNGPPEFLKFVEVLDIICASELFVAVEQSMDLFVEERDIQSLSHYPRITDVIGAWRVFSSQNVHAVTTLESPVVDFTIKGFIERALKGRGKKLIIEDIATQIITSRFRSPVKLRRLTATGFS